MVSARGEMNRWWVVFGAVLIQLCLGAIYAWSVFTPCLRAAPYNFTATQTQGIFSTGLASFAVVTILAGRLMTRFKPRHISIAGGVVLGLGYIIAGFLGTSFIGHVLAIGLVGGAGIGLGYVVPIAVGVKWFPDRKGLLTGLAVAGFGLGAFLWIMAAGRWCHLIDQFGVARVFQVYGLSYIVLVLIGSIWMVNPPEGWAPRGWTPPMPSVSSAHGAVNLNSRQMLRTPQFYALWFMFAAGAMAGLMIIGNIALFGIDALTNAGMDPATARAKTGTAMAIFFAMANASGRVVWGAVSDRIGRKSSLIMLFFLQSLMLPLFYYLGSREMFFYVGSMIIGFNFGGNFALFPAATADFFGNRTVGLNYGWVFSSYGIGGIVGPILAGRFADTVKTHGVSAWMTPFMTAGLLCLMATVVAVGLRPPAAMEAGAER